VDAPGSSVVDALGSSVVDALESPVVLDALLGSPVVLDELLGSPVVLDALLGSPVLDVPRPGVTLRLGPLDVLVGTLRREKNFFQGFFGIVPVSGLRGRQVSRVMSRSSLRLWQHCLTRTRRSQFDCNLFSSTVRNVAAVRCLHLSRFSNPDRSTAPVHNTSDSSKTSAVSHDCDEHHC
jgi:hypothetical protein